MSNCIITRKESAKKTYFVNLSASKSTNVYSDVLDTESTSMKTWYAYGGAVKWNSNRWMYVTLEGSNDNNNWTEFQQLSTGCAGSSAYALNAMFSLSGSISYRYYRIRMRLQSDNADSGGTNTTLILVEQ